MALSASLVAVLVLACKPPKVPDGDGGAGDGGGASDGGFTDGGFTDGGGDGGFTDGGGDGGFTDGGGSGDGGGAAEDIDGDGWTVDEGDCADLDPEVNPGMAELCGNATDDDCDSLVDPDREWYFDVDGDTWGDPDELALACDAPHAYVGRAGDCAPEDPTVHPGAHEVCGDGVDVDCDGTDDAPSGEPELQDWTAEAFATGAELGGGADWGAQVVPAGDLDGDGADDLLVFNEYDDSAGYASGIVQVFRGPLLGSFSASDAWLTLRGESAYHYVGNAVASGDFDGDGDIDLAVGAPGDGRSWPGQVYLVAGPLSAGDLDISVAATTILQGEVDTDHAGAALANAGDTDGDGTDDLLVGAPYASSVASYAGAAYLVRLPAPGEYDLGDADLVLRGAVASGLLGNVVASAGDQDGDGLPDLLVAAPYEDIATGYSNEGAVYVLSGLLPGEVGTDDALARLYEETQPGFAGAALATGDLDADGQVDIVVGAPSSDHDSVDSMGDAYVLYGPVVGERSLWDADVQIEGWLPYTFLSQRLDVPGDLDGDGFDDLSVWVRGDAIGGTEVWAGTQLIFYGPLSCVDAAADADLAFRGLSSLYGFAPGDLDDDGRPDLAFLDGGDLSIVSGGGL